MKKALMGLGAVAVLALLAVGGGVVWAKTTANSVMAQTYEVHSHELTVPTPLSEDAVAALRTEKRDALAAEDDSLDDEALDAAADAAMEEVDLDALALAQAQERGKHLVEARYACIECHGKDFSGGVMVDDPAMGTWKGPNLTQGEGSRVKDYTTADWDRIVRHGVKPDGTPAIMPSEDFVGMSDQELSDILAYIQTFPPVDNTVPAPTFGPISTMLLATGKMPISAEHHAATASHAALPPKTEATAEFGKHLAQICTGCHRAELNGGPMPFGPPDWPPARNLTPHESGLAGWTYDQFAKTMREGNRPDGTPLKEPMALMTQYAQNMTEVEMQAMFAYLQSVKPLPTGE